MQISLNLRIQVFKLGTGVEHISHTHTHVVSTRHRYWRKIGESMEHKAEEEEKLLPLALSCHHLG